MIIGNFEISKQSPDMMEYCVAISGWAQGEVPRETLEKLALKHSLIPQLKTLLSESKARLKELEIEGDSDEH